MRKRIAGLLVVATIFTGVFGAVTAPPAQASSVTCSHQTQNTHHLNGIYWHAVNRTLQNNYLKIYWYTYKRVLRNGFYVFEFYTSGVLNCGQYA